MPASIDSAKQRIRRHAANGGRESLTVQARGYSLWLMPRGPAGARLAGIIRDLSKIYRTPCFPPHVTLLAQIAQPEREVLALTRELVSAEKLRRFPVRLGGLANTGAYFRSLFIRVDESEALLGAYECTRKWFGSERSDEFMPHLSLLYGELAEKDKRSIIARLDRCYPARYTARAIAIYATEGAPENWRLIRSVALA